MTPDEIAAVLRHQRARGPLPSSAEGLSAWIAALQHQLPPIAVELQSQWNAISRLRAAGLVVEEAEGKAILRFPPDGDALDRTFALLGLPPIPCIKGRLEGSVHKARGCVWPVSTL